MILLNEYKESDALKNSSFGLRVISRPKVEQKTEAPKKTVKVKSKNEADSVDENAPHKFTLVSMPEKKAVNKIISCNISCNSIIRACNLYSRSICLPGT